MINNTIVLYQKTVDLQDHNKGSLGLWQHNFVFFIQFCDNAEFYKFVVMSLITPFLHPENPINPAVSELVML